LGSGVVPTNSIAAHNRIKEKKKQEREANELCCSLAKNYSMSVYILKLKFSTCEAESNNGEGQRNTRRGSQGQLHRWQMSTRSGPHLTVKWRTFKQRQSSNSTFGLWTPLIQIQVLNTNSPLTSGLSV